MKVQALGVSGGISPDMKTSSFRINDTIVVDAGSVASSLTVEEQLKIDHVFISHPHLDHIKDLCFLADNVIGMRKKPVKIYSSPGVIKAIRDHLFNNILWPDFTKIPSADDPTMLFEEIPVGGSVQVDGVTLRIVEVNHPVPAVGFLISDHECSFVISGDTGPTEEIWEQARKLAGDPQAPLKGIITEVSFPNQMQYVADLAGHFTAREFGIEVEKKFPKNIPIFLYHLKPPHWDIVMKEVRDLGLPNVDFLFLGETLEFSPRGVKKLGSSTKTGLAKLVNQMFSKKKAA